MLALEGDEVSGEGWDADSKHSPEDHGSPEGQRDQAADVRDSDGPVWDQPAFCIEAAVTKEGLCFRLAESNVVSREHGKDEGESFDCKEQAHQVARVGSVRSDVLVGALEPVLDASGERTRSSRSRVPRVIDLLDGIASFLANGCAR